MVLSMIENARASESVDEVVSEAPATVDVSFLDEAKCDFVVCLEGNCSVSDDIIAAKRALVIRHDGVAHLLERKEEKTE